MINNIVNIWFDLVMEPQRESRNFNTWIRIHEKCQFSNCFHLIASHCITYCVPQKVSNVTHSL